MEPHSKAQGTLRGYGRDCEIPYSLRSLHPIFEQLALFREMRTGWDAVAGDEYQGEREAK